MLDKRGTRGRWTVEPGQLWRVWLPAACSLVFAAAMFWSFCRRPSTTFFVDERPAQWIIYPAIPDPASRPDGPWRAVFRRQFSLDRAPRHAVLTIKAYREFQLKLNGVEMARSAASQSWKSPRAIEIRDGLLRVGENELEVAVTCRRWTPALWLALEIDSQTVASDERWEASLLGAEARPARLAASVAEFRAGTAPADAERTLESLALTWPKLLLFMLLSAAIVGLLRRCHASAAGAWVTAKGDWLLCAAIALAWFAMLVWNWRSLDFFLGFDSALHLEYVEYIQRHARLPTGSEGPEMWQPPLYYVLAALLSSLLHTSAHSKDAVVAARALAYLLSVSQLFLVASCLRRLLPNAAAPRAAGLLLAGCLPAQLCLMHYNTNDILAGTLGTASLATAVAVIQSPSVVNRHAICLGFLLGASVITKLTAWPVVLAVILALLWQLGAERRRAWEWMARLVVPVALAGSVCGWYFVRNYRNFGGLLPPDQAGFDYGQDLGYAMPVQFVRFGQALVQPFYSAFAGIPDGVYSTLWGDGLWGGEALLEMRPPWNYDLMAATYLLALAPSGIIAVGCGSVLQQALRRWQPEKLVLLGAAAGCVCGIAYFYLHHPNYGAIKAHYALPGIAVMCLFMAEGYAVIVGPSFWRQAALTTALGTWGLASLAGFYISPWSPQTAIRIARQHMLDGQPDRALTRIQQAIALHPHERRLRLMQARILEWQRRYAEARATLATIVEDNPNNADAQLRLAHALVALGQGGDAVALLENAIRLAPDNPEAYRELALLGLRRNNPETALKIARAGLRTAPSDPLLHYLLAEASMQCGELEQAVEHYQTAIAFYPEYTPALSVLARLYATHPDPRVRNAVKGVELAERASQLTEHTNPMIEDILAAAYAEAGDFGKAEQRLRAALERLPPDSSAAVRQQLGEHLERAERKLPWRDPTLDPPE